MFTRTANRAGRPAQLRVEGLEDRTLPSGFFSWLTGGWVERDGAPRPQISFDNTPSVIEIQVGESGLPVVGAPGSGGGGALRPFVEIIGTDRGEDVTVTFFPRDRLPARVVVSVLYDMEMERDGFWATGDWRIQRTPMERTFFTGAGGPPAIFFIGKGGDDTFTNNSGGRAKAWGGEGTDVLRGGPADDYLVGGEGGDTLRGGGGQDVLAGDFLHTDRNGRARPGEAADLLEGGDGIDYLIGGGGGDELWGGVEDQENAADQADFLIGDYLTNTVSGRDTIHGGRGGDLIYGGEGDDTLRGGIGNDVLIGGNGSDTLRGGEGQDTLESGFLSARPADDLRRLFIDPVDGDNGYTDPILLSPILNAGHVRFT